MPPDDLRSSSLLQQLVAVLDAGPGALRTLLAQPSQPYQAFESLFEPQRRASPRDVLSAYGLPTTPGAQLAADVLIDPGLLAGVGAAAFLGRRPLARGARSLWADELGGVGKQAARQADPRLHQIIDPDMASGMFGRPGFVDHFDDQFVPKADYLAGPGPRAVYDESGGLELFDPDPKPQLQQHSLLAEAIQNLGDKPLRPEVVEQKLVKQVPQLRARGDYLDDVHGMALGKLAATTGVNKDVYAQVRSLMLQQRKHALGSKHLQTSAKLQRAASMTDAQIEEAATRAATGLLTRDVLLEQYRQVFGNMIETAHDSASLRRLGFRDMANHLTTSNVTGGRNRILLTYRRVGDVQPGQIDPTIPGHTLAGDMGTITVSDWDVTLPNGKRGLALKVDQSQNDAGKALYKRKEEMLEATEESVRHELHQELARISGDPYWAQMEPGDYSTPLHWRQGLEEISPLVLAQRWFKAGLVDKRAPKEAQRRLAESGDVLPDRLVRGQISTQNPPDESWFGGPYLFAPYASRWQELSWKRALVHAAHNNYDALILVDPEDLARINDIRLDAAEAMWGARRKQEIRELLVKEYGLTNKEALEITARKATVARKSDDVLRFNGQEWADAAEGLNLSDPHRIPASDSLNAHDLTEGGMEGLVDDLMYNIVDAPRTSASMQTLGKIGAHSGTHWTQIIDNRPGDRWHEFWTQMIDDFTGGRTGISYWDNYMDEWLNSSSPNMRVDKESLDHMLGEAYLDYGGAGLRQQLRQNRDVIRSNLDFGLEVDDWGTVMDEWVEIGRTRARKALEDLVDKIIQESLPRQEYTILLTDPAIRKKIIQGGLTMGGAGVLAKALERGEQNELSQNI